MSSVVFAPGRAAQGAMSSTFCGVVLCGSAPKYRNTRTHHELICTLALTVLSACGDNSYRNAPYFEWDDSTAVGAFSMDHLTGDHRAMLNTVDRARDISAVVLFYGHDPPRGTSYEAIEGLLARAAREGVPTFTFADLATETTQQAGICLSFDDADVDAWYSLRDILARYHARVSFFVSQYHQLTDDQRAKLHVLYNEGNSIEAHGVNHLAAEDYISEHGLEAYLDNEVQLSIDVLRADGFDPVAYAHPGGSHSRELDDALASRIRFARSISGRPR